MYKIVVLLLTLSFFFSYHTSVYAALVTIQKDGKMVMNVLPAYDEVGSSSKPDSLTVTSVANSTSPSGKSEIALKNSSGKLELVVNDESGTKLADVTDYKNEIVEIEQRYAPDKISILAAGAGFVLRENSISAYTSFPITIDPEQKRISVETSSGEQFLAVLPSDALKQVVQGKIIDTIDSSNLLLTNGEKGEIEYTIYGKKTLNILHLVDYQVPVTARVSAMDGEVISVDQPLWLPIASFLFT